MAPRQEIVDFLSQYLRVQSIRDLAVNGLQVIGKPEVQRLALGVSANLALFEEALAWSADAVLVHHGLFLRDEPRRIDAILRARLKPLFDGDVNLLAYHLPLDAHPEVGNSLQLARRLGLDILSQDFAPLDGAYLGVIAQTPRRMPLNDFVAQVNAVLGGTSVVLSHGPGEVQRLAITAGGGASEVMEAINAGCDLYLTGEAREPTQALCREGNINYVAAGHHNTEKFGVVALGEVLSKRFGLQVRFVDVPNAL
ncbi:MAG: Nif3-like dinuclear metal center hexameric protein [Chloroflexi bacterium]|nr:Nif3-like dinuclear metal center hexameric protein [Chloroflexota bacterium]